MVRNTSYEVWVHKESNGNKEPTLQIFSLQPRRGTSIGFKMSNAEELFPSEDEAPVQPEPEKRKRKSSKSASTSKKSKAEHAHRVTAAELFGSDSEDDDVTPPAPSPVHSANSEATNIMMHCQKCEIDLPKHKYRYHIMRTNLHKSNCLLKSEFNNIEIIATAFKNRIVTYRLNPTQEVEYLTPEAFLCEKQSDVLKVIEILLNKHNCIKINFELFVNFTLPETNAQQLKSFNTKYQVVYRSTDLNELYDDVVEKVKEKMIEFQHCTSGWSYFGISHLEIN
ncbi:uncharacterized protein LOC114362701 isoform X1 [Ostrinia furnacalis]|uniref:uncharacterized protein LOC114362701 isoform X1 n=1 Tax=Ostrinia furnacalis TaxID=93504 RepID=UPI00103F63E0|nr:uncharacterized protein LOC114362701 isoform X1 [Ostrinia furnacalis]